MTILNRTYGFCTLVLLVFLSSCSDDDAVTPDLQIPSTYNFENVHYDGQLQRLSQFTELKTYMSTSRNSGTVLDPVRLQAMYANDAANAQWMGSYDDSKEMRGKTFEGVRDDFDALFIELAEASKSVEPGSEGVSGIIVSNDGEKSYLIGDDGLDHAQLIEKGLMGALLYYQATSVYMGADRMNVDNETVEPGEGTAMEHHWDEAFGYLGVPVDFPANTDGLLFWGAYSNNRDALLGSNQSLMNAMLKGRAAISAGELSIRDEAIDEARGQWELVAVASALHYLNEGIAEFDDMALRAHSLSEGIGFIYSLQFNEAKTITNDQINELLQIVAGSADFSEMNLYQTTIERLQDAKDKLAAYYGLEDKMDDF